MKKKILGLIFMVLLLGNCTGCVGKDAKIYGEKEVLAYVDEICREPYALVDKELIAQEPDNMEYYFSAEDRELTFTANSYLSQMYFDATALPYYERKISCNYVQAVHALYAEQIEEVLHKSERYLEEHGWFYVCSFSDLEEIVAASLEADRIWKQELAYNSADFLKDNPLRSIHLVWRASEEEAAEHKHWTNMTNVPIDGQVEQEELYDLLANQYAALSVDGKIEDRGDIPQEYLQDKHVSVLNTIELDGTEMLYDDNSNPYGIFGMITDKFKNCWYSYEHDSYMLTVDIGLIMENQSMVLINREYVNALGGSYSLKNKEDVCVSEWTIGEDEWKFKVEFADNEIKSVRLEKNGEEVEITYVTVDEDSHVGASFCIGVAADDVCKMFNLTYDVEEENQTIRFYSK